MQIVDILELLVPDVWTAITQLCATAILFFLMYKLAWKPVKKILDERNRFEQEKLSEAAALKEENEKISKQAKDIISDANRDAEMIVKEAREEGQTLKNELIAEGKKAAADWAKTQLGRVRPVLVEDRDENGIPRGYTPEYAQVRVPGGVQGEIADVKLAAYGEDGVFEGEKVRSEE